MTSKTSLVAIYAALLLMAACNKDEFKESPFDPKDIITLGTTDTLPTNPVPEPYMCKHIIKEIDLDSMAKDWKPFDLSSVIIEACECDTVSVFFVNETLDAMFGGWNQIYPTLKINSQMTYSIPEIIDDRGWFVEIYDTAVISNDLSFTVAVQFDTCSAR